MLVSVPTAEAQDFGANHAKAAKALSSQYVLVLTCLGHFA
jgi:hypothetical protein